VLPAAGTTSTPIAAALGALLGPVGATIASVGVVLSVYGWLTGFTLMMPRVLYSMANRGELPARLAYVHPRFRTPSVAIVVNAAIALGMGLYSSFTQAAVMAAIARLVVFAATCGALVALRRTTASPKAGFIAPGGEVLAVLGVGFTFWLLSTRNLAQIWILLAVVAAGVLVRASMVGWRASPDNQ
jgi:basic amino acid/polyamine antiporter, APA family